MRAVGRWNSKGMRVLYMSENRSLSVLEVLVHLTDTLPDKFVLGSAEIPDDVLCETLRDSELPVNSQRKFLTNGGDQNGIGRPLEYNLRFTDVCCSACDFLKSHRFCSGLVSFVWPRTRRNVKGVLKIDRYGGEKLDHVGFSEVRNEFAEALERNACTARRAVRLGRSGRGSANGAGLARAMIKRELCRL